MTRLFLFIFGSITALALYLTIINFGMVSDNRLPVSVRGASVNNHQYRAK